ISLGRHLADVRTGRVGLRITELWVVKGIQELAPQLEFQPLRDREVLDQREVPQIQRLAPEPGQARGEKADVVRQSDALVGALFDGVDHTARLNGGIGEIEDARVKGRIDRLAIDVSPELARIPVEVN